MSEGLNKETLRELAGMVRSAMSVQVPQEGAIPFALVPEGYAVRDLASLIFNEHNARPERMKGDVKVVDPVSFVEYYTLFSDPNSRVFADESSLRVLAVLDYHAAAEGAPRWGQHRVTLTLRQSEEWRRWIGSNNVKFSQVAFAEFLEQNAIDITVPDPAHMMEVARDLHATNEVEFGAGVRMNDGQVRFKYTETVKATVGAGQLSVPDRFTVTIPAFVGGVRVPVEALLRFRVNDGKLVIWYTLVRPEEVIRDAFLLARNEIAQSLAIKIINGTL